MIITRIEFKDCMGDPDNYDINYNKTIKEINQHTAQGEGDKWYYEVIFHSGDIQMIFNPCRVFKSKTVELKSSLNCNEYKIDCDSICCPCASWRMKCIKS